MLYIVIISLCFGKESTTFIDEKYENLTSRPFNITTSEWSFIRCDFNSIVTPEEDGAAIYISTQEMVTLFISNCSFTDCECREGVVYAFAYSPGNVSIEVIGTSFTTTDGGSISTETYNIGSVITLNVEETRFVDCKAECGGAIFNEVWEPGSSICTKIGNSSFSTTARMGGSVCGYAHISGAAITLEIVKSNFSNCASEVNGGAIDYEAENIDRSLYVFECSFVDCSSGSDGSAIYCVSESFKSVINSMFIRCATGEETGGAISCTNGNITMKGCGTEDCFVSLTDCYGCIVNCCFGFSSYSTATKSIVLLESTYPSITSRLTVINSRARCASDEEFVNRIGTTEVDLDVSYTIEELSCFPPIPVPCDIENSLVDTVEGETRRCHETGQTVRVMGCFTARNCTFLGIMASYDVSSFQSNGMSDSCYMGGALALSIVSATLESCTFCSCTSHDGGGAVAVFGNNLTVIDTEFDNCTSDGKGREIICAISDVLNVNRSKFYSGECRSNESIRLDTELKLVIVIDCEFSSSKEGSISGGGECEWIEDGNEYNQGSGSDEKKSGKKVMIIIAGCTGGVLVIVGIILVVIFNKRPDMMDEIDGMSLKTDALLPSSGNVARMTG